MTRTLKIFVIIFVVGVSLLVYSISVKKTENNSALNLSSPAFQNGETIPAKYTCDSDLPAGGISPPLLIGGVPPNAKSLALIVDDPDAPVGLWIHWVVWNINPETKEIPENVANLGTQGRNTNGASKYGGPCPPDREHRYFFRLFALDTVLDIAQSGGREELQRAMKGHIITKAELMGRYDRKR